MKHPVGWEIRTRSQDFDLLAYLACRPGQIVSQEEMIETLWRYGCDQAAKHMLWNAVKRLRDKLGEDGHNPCYIRTVRRFGYQAIDSTGDNPTLQKLIGK